MIHQLIILLTTLSVLLHASLGCCVHHAHASCVKVSGVKVGETQACCHHHGEHHHLAKPGRRDLPRPFASARPDWPEQPPPCDEGECCFVSREQTSNVPRAHLLVTVPAIDGFCISPKTIGQQRRSADAWGLYPPQASLRALAQVWLL